MANKPITLVIGEPDHMASPYSFLSHDMALLFANTADEVIELTSDNEPVDLCVISAVDVDKARELCRWMKTDDEVKHLPLAVIGNGEGDAQEWLRAGAIDYLDRNGDPELLSARLKTYSQLKHKNDLLARIASLDSLTSLPNKRRMEEYLDIEWRRSLREYYPLSLIKLDLDQFTAFNDQYGVGCGDEALRKIARVLEATINRAADMLSRYSGDEFVALLPSLEIDSALLLAEKMVDAIRDLGIENESSDSQILTASVGVAMIEPTQDNRYQDLLDEAAEMLSRAQQMGGDQAQGIAV